MHKQANQILSKIIIPGVEQPLAPYIQKLTIDSERVLVRLRFGFPCPSTYQQALETNIRTSLTDFAAGRLIEVFYEMRIKAHAVQSGVKPIEGIKNIIGVASGKGGVGKSTTSINLALSLALAGARVGLLDADIYGPNQPHMLGIKQKPEMTQDKKLIPIERYGIKSMSMGYLVAEGTPMVWRGPMVSQALNQLLYDSVWGELDYLVVDLPPGTGDISLTLAKKAPVSGIVIVTTPQDVALLDANKALQMFNKLQVPVLGVIENMATHVCTQCGHEEAIFGAAGGEALAEKSQLPLLGRLPLALKIRQASDAGQPIVMQASETGYIEAYRELALQVAATLAGREKSYSHLFANVVVEKE